MQALSRAANLLPDALFVRSIAYANRRFEPELGRIVSSCPQHGKALDVGAWYGPWSYWLARRVDSVVAFEPNPEVGAVLARTVAANVRVVHAAVSDTVGTATLTLPHGGRGTEGRASLEGLSDGTRTVDVKTCRLDDLDLGPVILVKIDVEGHERAALSGAEQFITTSHPLLVVELEEPRGTIAPTIELLESWGYRGRVLVDKRWTPLDDFDLAGHQVAYRAEHAPASYLGTILRPKSPYINNVVFTHPETSWDVE